MPMETVILSLILILLVVFIVLLFLSRKEEMVNVRSQSSAAQTTVNVPAGSVVRIRHASDALTVEVGGPEQVYGPLSDASIDLGLLEKMTGGNCSLEEKKRIALIMAEQGMHIKIDGYGYINPEEPSYEESGIEYPDDGPVGELVPAAMGATCALDELRDLIVRGIKEHMCTPAFAKLASEEYGFTLEFEDPDMQRKAVDREELLKVESYRDAIRRNLSEAMHKYSQEHPAQSGNDSRNNNEQPSRVKASGRKIPDYDFSKMK